MDISSNNHLLPGDPRLVDYIVGELKFQGIFDQLRKECIADVDTKPAYQNLRQRVEGNVSSFLKSQRWKPDLNKNHVREMLRKNIQESGYLEIGVERIVDQVVNPKINTIFYSQVEDVVYKYLGIERPVKNQIKSTVTPLSVNTLDLLPTDLDPVSPASDKSPNKLMLKSEQEIEESNKLDDSFKIDEEESPPFEPIEDTKDFLLQDEISMDSQLSGISGLTSHDSNHSDTVEEKFEATAPDVANPDSQLSKVSSNSRLSIVTSDGKITPFEANNENKLSETVNSLSEKLKIDENSSSKHSSVEMNQESQADSEQSIEMKDEKICVTTVMNVQDDDNQIIDIKIKDEIEQAENEQDSVVEIKQEYENMMTENESVKHEPMDTADFHNLDEKSEEKSETELKELDRKRDKYTKEHESKRSRYSDSKDRRDRDRKEKGRHSSSSSSSRDKDKNKDKYKEIRKEKEIKDGTKYDKDKNIKDEKERSSREEKEKGTKDDKEDRNKKGEKVKSDDKSKSKENEKSKEKDYKLRDDKRDKSEKNKDDKYKSEKCKDKEDSKKRDEKHHSNSSSKYHSRDRSSSSKNENRRDSSGKEDSKDKSKSSKDYKNTFESKSKDSKVNKESRDSSKDSKSKSGDESKSLKESSRCKETKEEKDKDINGDKERNKDKEGVNGDVRNKYSKESSKDVKHKNKDRERTKSESKHNSSHKSSSGRDKKNKSHKDMKKESGNKKDIKDDHFSSKDKNTDGRRSADRDSNNGGSGSLSQGSNSSERNEVSNQKNNKESSSSDIGSQQSGNSEQSDHEVTIDAFQSKLDEADSVFTPAKVVKLDVIGKEISIMPCSSVPLKKRIHTMDTYSMTTESTVNNLQDDGQTQIKIKKPRFASNIFEARKLIKIRKRMEKMERKRQKQVLQYENQLCESESCLEEDGNSKNKNNTNNTKETEKENFDDRQQDKFGIIETVEMDNRSVILTKDNVKREKSKTESLPSKENSKIEIESPIKTSAISVISKESWDAIEAKLNQSTMLNIDYASYGYDSEASPTKSPSKIIYSDDEEDCLYFNPKTSPSTERYLKRIAALQKLGPNISVSEMFSEVNENSKINVDLQEGQKVVRRSRKPNMKYCSEEYASEDTLEKEKIEEDRLVQNEYVNKGKSGKTTLKKKISNIDLDDESDLTIDNNNIKLKTEIVKDTDRSEIKMDNASLNENATIIDNLEIIPIRGSKGRKGKKAATIIAGDIKSNNISPNIDNFNLPPSPESDVSASSVEIKSVVSRKRNLDTDTNIPKVNSRTPKTVTQRYSSDDLYKPRPLFGSTRRSRALGNTVSSK